VILIIGMGGRPSSIINSPILSFEVTQAGFGLYVKYLMAGFLGVFAVTMLIQFVSYFLDASPMSADEPGHRAPASTHLGHRASEAPKDTPWNFFLAPCRHHGTRAGLGLPGGLRAAGRGDHHHRARRRRRAGSFAGDIDAYFHRAGRRNG
jgi:hypothetical protein